MSNTYESGGKSIRENSNVDARRKILRYVVAGSTLGTGAALVPSTWTKPIVQTVILPAHAQTTLPAALCGTLPLGNPGEIIASMSWAGSPQMGLALLTSSLITIDFPIALAPSTPPLTINETGLAPDTYLLVAGMLGLPSIDITVNLQTEGGTQVFALTIPQAPFFPSDFTVVANITIPGGACPVGGGLVGGGGIGGGVGINSVSSGANWP